MLAVYGPHFFICWLFPIQICFFFNVCVCRGLLCWNEWKGLIFCCCCCCGSILVLCACAHNYVGRGYVCGMVPPLFCCLCGGTFVMFLEMVYVLWACRMFVGVCSMCARWDMCCICVHVFDSWIYMYVRNVSVWLYVCMWICVYVCFVCFVR